VIHHVAVCSSRCAELLADGAPARGATHDTPSWPRVARAVRASSSPLTLVIVSAGGRGVTLRCWWWAGRHCGSTRIARTSSRDVRTDAGLVNALRALVLTTRDELLRELLIDRRWHDVPICRDPVAVLRRLRTQTYRRAKQQALRARYRQRGQSQDGTADQASRVA